VDAGLRRHDVVDVSTSQRLGPLVLVAEAVETQRSRRSIIRGKSGAVVGSSGTGGRAFLSAISGSPLPPQSTGQPRIVGILPGRSADRQPSWRCAPCQRRLPRDQNLVRRAVGRHPENLPGPFRVMALDRGSQEQGGVVASVRSASGYRAGRLTRLAPRAAEPRGPVGPTRPARGPGTCPPVPPGLEARTRIPCAEEQSYEAAGESYPRWPGDRA
jgi:hypothetical protein